MKILSIPIPRLIVVSANRILVGSTVILIVITLAIISNSSAKLFFVRETARFVAHHHLGYIPRNIFSNREIVEFDPLDQKTIVEYRDQMLTVHVWSDLKVEACTQDDYKK